VAYLPEMGHDFAVTVASLAGGGVNAWLFLIKVPG
jgi:hypothetical protein